MTKKTHLIIFLNIKMLHALSFFLLTAEVYVLLHIAYACILFYHFKKNVHILATKFVYFNIFKG